MHVYILRKCFGFHPAWFLYLKASPFPSSSPCVSRNPRVNIYISNDGKDVWSLKTLFLVCCYAQNCPLWYARGCSVAWDKCDLFVTLFSQTKWFSNSEACFILWKVFRSSGHVNWSTHNNLPRTAQILVTLGWVRSLRDPLWMLDPGLLPESSADLECSQRSGGAKVSCDFGSLFCGNLMKVSAQFIKLKWIRWCLFVFCLFGVSTLSMLSTMCFWFCPW